MRRAIRTTQLITSYTCDRRTHKRSLTSSSIQSGSTSSSSTTATKVIFLNFLSFLANDLFKHLLSHRSLNLIAFAKCLGCKCDVTRSLTVWSSEQSASLRASKQSLSHRDFDGSWDSKRFSVFRWSLRVCDGSATCYPHRRTAHFVVLTAIPGRLLRPLGGDLDRWGGGKIHLHLKGVESLKL